MSCCSMSSKHQSAIPQDCSRNSEDVSRLDRNFLSHFPRARGPFGRPACVALPDTRPLFGFTAFSGARKSEQSDVLSQKSGDGTPFSGGFTSEPRQCVGNT